MSSSAPANNQEAQKPKRKRLAKACDACHKSKRRCDGTAPCANCDFAGKTCVYTDSSGHTVPPPIERNGSSGLLNGPSDVSTPSEPRKRKATQPPPAVSDNNHSRPAHSSYPPHPPPDSAAPPYYHPDLARSGSGLSRSDSRSAFPGERSPPYHAQRHPVPVVDPTVVHELVNLFFSHMHPYNLAIHRPSFLNDLGDGRVPQYLLMSVLALAAPLSDHPDVKTTPNHWAGEKYANAAKAMLFEPGGQLKERHCLEVAQALTLITMHDCIGRQAGRRTDYWQQIALDILTDIGVHSFDASFPSHSPQLARDEWLRRETSRRLFYVIYVVELLASIFTHRPIAHREQDLRIFLPAPESHFELTLANVPLSREYLLPLAPPDGSKSRTAEFGFLIRIVAIYTRIADNIFAFKHSMDDDSPHQKPNVVDVIRDGENALKTWEVSLPETLGFNERNLEYHLQTLKSGASVAGWCYCYMHIIAECCVLALQEAAELDPTRPGGSKSPAQTRELALQNLKTVLNALDPSAQKSIMMGVILEAATRHTLIATRGRPDPVLTGYCSDYESVWGINYDQLTSLEFRKQWVPDWPQDRLTASRKSGASSSSSSSQERDWIYQGRTLMPRHPVGPAPTATAGEGDATTSYSPRATTEAYWSSSAKEHAESSWAGGEGRDRPPWWRGPPRSPSPTSSSQASFRGVPTPHSGNYSSASPRERQAHEFGSSSQVVGSSSLGRARTFTSAPAMGGHEHKNSIGSSQEGTVKDYDEREPIQLPPLPPKFASADGDNSYIPRAKPGPTSLPSIHSFGLLNSLPPEGQSRQLPPPAKREEGPSP